MGLNLSNFFHLTNQNTTSQINQTSNIDGTSNLRAAEIMKGLSSGQTISGEVVSIRNGEIDIALDKDAYITAKLDRDMNLTIGQTLTFEVKSTAGMKIALMPLYENMAQNPTVSNAINAANIPFNEKSVEMVSTMMKEGMPIDKASLQDMYKQIYHNPDANGEMIVQMNRLHIPVTPENMTQFELYKNYEHSIMEGVETVADDLADTFHNMVQSGNTSEAVEFLQKLVQTFRMENMGQEAANSQNAVEQTTLQSEELQNTEQNGEVQNGEIQNNETGKELSQTAENVVAGNNQPYAVMKQQVSIQQTITPDFSNILGLNEKEAAKLAGKLEAAGIAPEIVNQVKNGTITPEQLLQSLDAFTKENGKEVSKELHTIWNSKEFTNLIKGQVTRQWMLPPEEVAKEGKVEELYRRIQQQTAKLTEGIANLVKENSPVMKSVTNLSNNVEFMNQLNQAFTYVQLPLKMWNGNTHGELYVYTNKKNLAKKDGNVSALLHLDMEYLGAMDIYVAMQQNKVSTKFYLEKEEYIDFIAENIHILDERLQKRGYTMQAELIQKEQKTNVLDEMMNQEKNQGMGNSLVSKYAFDARA